MRKLIKTIDLVFFCDDANGEYGLTHKETYQSDSGFNAFWDGMGIFHDVFEHAHEHTDKYFRDEFAMNVGGEMAAMGAMWYYYDELGVGARLRSGYNSPGTNMRVTTESLIQESISHGNSNFGNELLSNVPEQTEVENSELECQIETLAHNALGFEVRATDETERGHCLIYKDSVTEAKIANLHRYGFRMAQAMVPNNWQNQTTLSLFFSFWNGFCKVNSAEELANYYRGVTFKIYREGDEIFWKATFVKDPYAGAAHLEFKSWNELNGNRIWEMAA